MPRVTWDWEAEYTDPVSEAEDKALDEELERMNNEIMYEIYLCREEDDWWERKMQEQEELEEELRLEELYDDSGYYDYLAHY